MSRDYVSAISGRNPELGAKIRAANTVLNQAAKDGKVIVIEVVQDGKPMYLVEPTCFVDPVENPLMAKNYARDAERDPEFNDLWYNVACIYVKDVGGGKSSARSDVPGQIVVFEVPKLIAPELARFTLDE